VIPAPPPRDARAAWNFEIGRFGIHWPEIDEDIELADLLLGARATPGATPQIDT
jgi:hypothetical protein